MSNYLMFANRKHHKEIYVLLSEYLLKLYNSLLNTLKTDGRITTLSTRKHFFKNSS